MVTQLTEKEMLKDALMMEKQVSAGYDFGIMESANSQIFQAFSQIQKQEQSHAQLLFDMMNKKGWYDVQPAHTNQAAQKQLNEQMQSQSSADMTTFKQNGNLL